MKFVKTLCVALLAVWSISSTAASNKKSKKGQPALVEAVDTFSYLSGTALTEGLIAYLAKSKGVDSTYMKDFLKGFDQAELSQADKRAKARLAGMEIRQQLEEQTLPGLNKQISDSADVLVKELFMQGFRDALAGQNPTLSLDSAKKTAEKQFAHYKKLHQERLYAANRAAGEAFLELNAKKDSVQTTPSGLQYKVLTQGNGPKPQPTHKVSVHYEGRLIDGTVFDSSYKRGKPATFPCGGLIPGWTEALCMMPVGSKWELYIPQNLGYGAREQSKIPPYSVLVFTVELLGIEK